MATSTFITSLAKRLEGKVAIITGGASGIGECTAKLFAAHGARLIIADIEDNKGRALCSALGPTATYVHCDVTSEPDVSAAVDAAVLFHGKLDIMFSNAGIVGKGGLHQPLATSEVTEFEHVMRTNVTGSFLATKHAARVMAPARNGSVVMSASTASVVGGMGPHSYTCSKHAMVGLVRSAAAELGEYGVRVNCVSLHGVATPMAMRELGMDEEGVEELMERIGNLKGVRLKCRDVAEAVLYLGSDEGRYVSGVNLMVDGGSTAVRRLL